MLIDIALYYVGGRGGVETVTTKVYENLKKKEYSLKAALCKKCGYVELYVDVKED